MKWNDQFHGHSRNFADDSWKRGLEFFWKINNK
jgi:hypothetical protein